MAATSNTIRDLPPADLSRLEKLAGMLGSDFDGERAAAAAMASKLLQSHGLTWADVIRAPAAAPSGTSYKQRGFWMDPEGPHDALRVLHEYADVLFARNEWLANFVADLRTSSPAKISIKQQHKIREALDLVKAYVESTEDYR
jgi:hypothetical protein